MAQSPIFTQQGSGQIYEVQQGDTLYGLVIASRSLSLLKPDVAISLVHQDNPHIANPNQIFPGDLVFIRDRNAVGNPLQTQTIKDVEKTVSELNNTRSLGNSGINWANVTTTTAFAGSSETATALRKLTAASAEDIGSIIKSYEEMKSGKKSKHHHYKSRRQSLVEIQKQLGPLERKLLKGAADVKLVMQRGGGANVNRTAPMVEQAKGLNKVASQLRRGGAALSGVSFVVDVGFTHHGVCTAPDTRSKNLALVSGASGAAGGMVGGFLGGAAGGAVVAFFIASNPVGWTIGIGILGAAALGAVGSVGASKVATHVYDKNFSQVDIIGAIPIDGGCSIYK